MSANRSTAYASATMKARRERILCETRRLIAADGIEGFRLNDVSARAGVAVRTLYNSFGTRESVIAAAIQERFAAHMSATPNPHAAGSLERNLERMAITARFFDPRRNYLRAALTLYFASDASGELRATIDRSAREGALAFLGPTAAADGLHPWAAADELADDLVRFEIATLNDWAHDRLDGADVAPRLLRGHLALVIGATRGAARETAERRLAALSEATPLARC